MELSAKREIEFVQPHFSRTWRSALATNAAIAGGDGFGGIPRALTIALAPLIVLVRLALSRRLITLDEDGPVRWPDSAGRSSVCTLSLLRLYVNGIAGAVIVAGIVLAMSAVLSAEPPAEPQVNKPFAVPLRAAQQAIEEKRYDDALVDVKQAQTVDADKTLYDSYVIDVLRVQIYSHLNDLPDEVQALQSAAQSSYATPEQQRSWFKGAAQYYFQQKDYRSAIAAGQQAVDHGALDDDTATLLAKAEYLDGRFSDAERRMWAVVNRQQKPTKDTLDLLSTFSTSARDDAGAAKARYMLSAPYLQPTLTDRDRAALRASYIFATRPRRRDSPLRDLNISDDEVREIQSAVAEVFPPLFVSIGGIVTGCAADDGAGCTDQAWVEMRQTNRTTGLLMSKVNDQWVIGPVQRWWLCDEDLEAHLKKFPSYDAYLAAKATLADHFPQCVVPSTAAPSP